VESLESRTYEVPVSQIKQVGASGQYDYEYDRKSLNIVVKGLKEDLDQLTSAAIQAELDVSSMEPGDNMGTVTLELGDAYELVSGNSVLVTVTEKGPSAPDGEAEEDESQSGTNESGESVKETTGA